MNARLEKLAKIWPGIQNIFSVPHNETEYNHLIDMLDGLIDEVGEDESHPLASLIETIGTLVKTYEDQNIPEVQGNPIETLKMLMAEHGLKQTDLPGIGSQGVVSEILSGKRQLNMRQIKYLSNRFRVSPAVFM
ncbi:MAG: transcriptional regulator [Desulfobacterales bacterium]|jgi:HTH-type transcriptional regulator/antitoxin HigA